MNPDNIFAWLVLLSVVAIIYYPTAKRIYRRWNRKRFLKQDPATTTALLGVVFPPSDKKDEY
jgi:hypothetical protein